MTRPLMQVAVCLAATACRGSEPVEAPEYTLRVLTTGLENPFEIAWGPDDALWVTERTAGRVTRVDPSDGTQRVVLTIDEVMMTEGTQDGLLGLALHTPEGATAPEHVFVAYTYDADAGGAVEDRRAKIRRYSYDPMTMTLGDPVDVITGLPASVDHNGGRLRIGPDEKLYYTIGDQGNNQYTRYCLPILAQEVPTAEDVAAGRWTAYQGKVLRLELDGAIPSDNPTFDGVQSHLFTIGHRNPQGLAFGLGDRIYQVEHGPKSDDELNLLLEGKNYGWPYVAGYQDDQAYVYGDWSASTSPPCEELEYSDYEIPTSVPQQEESDWSDPGFVPPLMTFYTVPDDHDFQDPACEDLYYICWPTVAPSSVEYYEAGESGVSSLNRSLLITTLKLGVVFQVKLRVDGTPMSREATALFRTVNRYRDLAFSPDGRTIYLATDTSGLARGLDEGPTTELENPGAILEYTAQ